jgi:hypothetical protein
MARFDLALSLAEFGGLTPRQFDRLLDRHELRERRAYLRAGIVAATVGNSAPFGDPDRKALSPLDFVPGGREPEKEMGLEEQIRFLKLHFGSGPPEDAFTSSGVQPTPLGLSKG